MKKLALVLGALSIMLVSFAQEYPNEDLQQDEFRTIFTRKGNEVNLSGFGGPIMSFGLIDGGFAHMMGGGGGVLINDFFFGGYGMGLTTSLPYKMRAANDDEEDDRDELEFGHGGFWAGYVIGSNRAIHLSLSSQFGWGNLGKSRREEILTDHNQPVFVISPIVELEMNFSQFFRVGIGGTTMYVTGLDNTKYTNSDFLNPNVYVSFKFGWFD